jgi:hypothetical protein
VSRPRLRPSPTVRPPLRPEEQQAARRRARDRSLLRDGIVLLLVILGLAVAWALRLTPTPDLPAAREVTARIDVAYDAVQAGTLELGTDPEPIAEGIVGARVTTGDTARWVVTGQAGRECYAMWWDEAGTRRVRVVPSTLPCEPASQLTSPRPDTYGTGDVIALLERPTGATRTGTPSSAPTSVTGVGQERRVQHGHRDPVRRHLGGDRPDRARHRVLGADVGGSAEHRQEPGDGADDHQLPPRAAVRPGQRRPAVRSTPW